jgi:hypothetical protein
VLIKLVHLASEKVTSLPSELTPCMDAKVLVPGDYFLQDRATICRALVKAWIHEMKPVVRELLPGPTPHYERPPQRTGQSAPSVLSTAQVRRPAKSGTTSPVDVDPGRAGHSTAAKPAGGVGARVVGHFLAPTEAASSSESILQP